MVERRRAVRILDAWRREELLAEGGYLTTACPGSRPAAAALQASCWRAEVDHSRMAIEDDWDDVLQIAL